MYNTLRIGGRAYDYCRTGGIGYCPLQNTLNHHKLQLMFRILGAFRVTAIRVEDIHPLSATVSADPRIFPSKFRFGPTICSSLALFINRVAKRWRKTGEAGYTRFGTLCGVKDSPLVPLAA